jgi:hypothetical protein
MNTSYLGVMNEFVIRNPNISGPEGEHFTARIEVLSVRPGWEIIGYDPDPAYPIPRDWKITYDGIITGRLPIGKSEMRYRFVPRIGRYHSPSSETLVFEEASPADRPRAIPAWAIGSSSARAPRPQRDFRIPCGTAWQLFAMAVIMLIVLHALGIA